MRFKEFLLRENNENYFAVKVGDILTALQTTYEDSGVMSRKDVDNLLSNVVTRIRPLLKTKSTPHYQKTLQKVATNIMKYLDPQVPNTAVDPKILMLSCIKEIENLLSGKSYALNKINKKEEDGLSKSQSQQLQPSINGELKNQSSNMKEVEPPNPGMETGVDNDKTPPMAGDGARTLNVL